MPKVHAIVIYPIKAFDGVPLSSCIVSAGGALNFDRRYAFRTEPGGFVNGKKLSRVHFVRTSFDLQNFTVSFALTDIDKEYTFHLKDDTSAIEEVFSGYFSAKVKFEENADRGFPDDTEAWGPTIVSLESLKEVNRWFPELPLQEVMRRFRPNIIIEDAPAFWEDRLFGVQGTETEFTIGDIRMKGSNPCQRCVVPTRDTKDGTVLDKFQKTFAENRERTLPVWAEHSRFNHFYRFCVNTRIASSEAGKIISIGDYVTLDTKV
jgi:uncharacterized protein YcbX